MSLTSPPVVTDTPPESGPIASTNDRKKSIAAVIGSLVFAFLMVIMMTSTYLGTMHAPSPHDMPVAVIGSGSAAEGAVYSLEKAENSPASIQIVDSVAQAEKLLQDREISGAIALPADGSADRVATIYTASAAGASQASVVTQILSPLAVDAGLTVENTDVAPLPVNDSAGIAAMFMAMALMLAGYMPIGLMLTGAPELLRLRRFVPVWAGWSALMSAIVWFIAGPVIGSFSGHTAAILGIGWLTVFSIGLVQLFLSRILGAAAVLVGMLLVVVLGMPASNLAMSVHTMPGFFGFLHGVLPLAGAGEAFRSVLYFGGTGVAGYLWRFVFAAVLAVLVTAGIDLGRRKKKAKALAASATILEPASATVSDTAPATVLESAPAAPVVDPTPTSVNPRSERKPAMPGGKPRSTPVRYLILAIFPFAMVALMLGIMLSAMHSPSPANMPIAVVSATSAQAEQLAEGLAQNTDGMFTISTLTNVDTASEMVFSGELVGAFVLPDAEHPTATLITSGAAGTGQQMVVQRVAEQVAAQMGVEITPVDVAPLPATDTNGAVSMYIAMGWVMAGFLGVTVLVGGAPWQLRVRKQLPTLAVWSIFMSLITWVIAGPLVGAYHGPVLPLLGIGALTIFCLGLVTAAVARLMGILSVVPIVTVFMFIGVPASGGGLSTYMEPGLFQTLHDVLPLPAALGAIRSIAFFGGAGLGSFLLTLSVWGIFGLVANLIISAFHNARSARRLRNGSGDMSETESKTDSRVEASDGVEGRVEEGDGAEARVEGPEQTELAERVSVD
ncbi:ABC transporter permease [Glaciibacter psychrotolerans]|uniref:ABC transporter permease n=1 Tax=Glaciibacter psychrotolerans TaxID=670054 RepID=A0A7Z0ECP8_9MICO|nr:ABC transporter permease [Leifsonia psychrotolerans]NYJ19063.1 hypothetical protein [Leifsonia psychrotolerans]